MEPPWLKNKEWATGRIRCKTGTAVIAIWIMAVVANGFVWTVMMLVRGDPDEGGIVKVLLLFALVGLVLLYFAVRSTLGWFRYGSSILELASIPGVIGGTLEGTIQTRLRTPPAKPARVSLSCNREYRVRAPKRSGDADTTSTAVLWQGDTTVAVDRVIPGPTGLSIPFLVRIPYGLPESDSSQADQKIIWKLAVSCEFPGIDYAAEFVVPAFVTPQSNPEWTTELVDAMTDEGEKAASSPDDRPSANLGGTFTVRPTERGGTRYEFRLQVPARTAIALPAAGLLITGGSVCLYLWLDEMGPFAILPGLIGALLLLASIIVWTYRSRVVIEEGLVMVRKSVLRIPVTWRIPFSEIASVRVRHEIVEGLEGKNRDWDIEFDRRGKAPVRAGASFRERSEADRVANDMKRCVAGRPKTSTSA